MEPIVEDVLIGRIYMIYNIKTPHMYIGSTTTTLRHRWKEHCAHRKSNCKLYSFMRDIGIDNFRIKLIEWKQVETETELRQLEQYHIDKYNKEILLNSADAYLDKEKVKKYYRNKDKAKQWQHIYYTNNVDRLKEWNKLYRQSNKEKVNEMNRTYYNKVMSNPTYIGCYYRRKHKESLDVVQPLINELVDSIIEKFSQVQTDEINGSNAE